MKKIFIIFMVLMMFSTIVYSEERHTILAKAILLSEHGEEIRMVVYKDRHSPAMPQVKRQNGWEYITDQPGRQMSKNNTDTEEYYGIHEYIMHIGIVPSWMK
ncbi:MAG: hypothetical protein WC405_17070 [Syntrophales bacterium]